MDTGKLMVKNLYEKPEFFCSILDEFVCSAVDFRHRILTVLLFAVRIQQTILVARLSDQLYFA